MVAKHLVWHFNGKELFPSDRILLRLHEVQSQGQKSSFLSRKFKFVWIQFKQVGQRCSKALRVKHHLVEFALRSSQESVIFVAQCLHVKQEAQWESGFCTNHHHLIRLEILREVTIIETWNEAWLFVAESHTEFLDKFCLLVIRRFGQ